MKGSKSVPKQKSVAVILICTWIACGRYRFHKYKKIFRKILILGKMLLEIAFTVIKRQTYACFNSYFRQLRCKGDVTTVVECL